MKTSWETQNSRWFAVCGEASHRGISAADRTGVKNGAAGTARHGLPLA